jgi:hypothetical protein
MEKFKVYGHDWEFISNNNTEDYKTTEWYRASEVDSLINLCLSYVENSHLELNLHDCSVLRKCICDKGLRGKLIKELRGEADDKV